MQDGEFISRMKPIMVTPKRSSGIGNAIHINCDRVILFAILHCKTQGSIRAPRWSGRTKESYTLDQAYKSHSQRFERLHYVAVGLDTSARLA